MAEKYYIRFDNIGHFGKRKIESVTIDDGDWMYALSGDEVKIPASIALPLIERISQGEKLTYRAGKIYEGFSSKEAIFK